MEHDRVVGPGDFDLEDPNLEEKLVNELKAQGIFDQFRKDCLSDVDTKVGHLLSFEISNQLRLKTNISATIIKSQLSPCWFQRNDDEIIVISSNIHFPQFLRLLFCSPPTKTYGFGWTRACRAI